MGIRCIIHIDDILILHQDSLQLARCMAVAVDLIQRQAGLNLKTSKCSFRPSQRFQCLGYVWDTTIMKTFVPDKRLKETHRTAKRLLRMVLAQGATGAAPPPAGTSYTCSTTLDKQCDAVAGMGWLPSPLRRLIR